MTENESQNIGAPNDLLNWQISAIGNQGAVELGQKVLVRFSGSRDSGQGTQSILGGGQPTIGEARLLCDSVWAPSSVQ